MERSSLLVLGGVLLVVLAASSSALFETNDLGHYQVKQAALSGKASVRNEPGVYAQMFGKITDYNITGLVEFSADGQGDGAPLTATFRGNSTAELSGIMKYQLSRADKDQLSLHERYGSNHAVHQTLVKQALAEAIKQTGPLFTPEEAFVTRRADFTKTILEMVHKGVLATYTEEVTIKDDGNNRVETVTKLKMDKDGNHIVDKASSLLQYNIQVIDFAIRDLKFDELTSDLIAAKKKTEQEKVVARANSEKAKQDAITAVEQGKAKVATAEAEKNVEKIRAVTDAKKEAEVAGFLRQKAEQEARAKTVQGEAEAAVSRLKVAAGLSPAERAEFEMKTRIGVAAELAKTKFPENLIIAGGNDGKGGAVDPWTAVGLNNAYDLSRKMAQHDAK